MKLFNVSDVRDVTLPLVRKANDNFKKIHDAIEKANQDRNKFKRVLQDHFDHTSKTFHAYFLDKRDIRYWNIVVVGDRPLGDDGTHKPAKVGLALEVRNSLPVYIQNRKRLFWSIEEKEFLNAFAVKIKKYIKALSIAGVLLPDKWKPQPQIETWAEFVKFKEKVEKFLYELDCIIKMKEEEIEEENNQVRGRLRIRGDLPEIVFALLREDFNRRGKGFSGEELANKITATTGTHTSRSSVSKAIHVLRDRDGKQIDSNPYKLRRLGRKTR